MPSSPWGGCSLTTRNLCSVVVRRALFYGFPLSSSSPWYFPSIVNCYYQTWPWLSSRRSFEEQCRLWAHDMAGFQHRSQSTKGHLRISLSKRSIEAMLIGIRWPWSPPKGLGDYIPTKQMVKQRSSSWSQRCPRGEIYCILRGHEPDRLIWASAIPMTYTPGSCCLTPRPGTIIYYFYYFPPSIFPRRSPLSSRSMSSTLLHSVIITSPCTRLCRFDLSPPFGLSSSHQAAHFPRRADQKRNGPGVRIRCTGSRVSREYGGPTEEEAAAAAAAASFFGGYDLAEDGESDDEEEDADDAESSLDLLIRFLQNMFRNVARQAKRASRSVLPPAIPQQMVGLLLYVKDLFLFLFCSWD